MLSATMYSVLIVSLFHFALSLDVPTNDQPAGGGWHRPKPDDLPADTPPLPTRSTLLPSTFASTRAKLASSTKKPFVPQKGLKHPTKVLNPIFQSVGSCKWNDKPYQAGSRMDHGSFWYECVKGEFIPKGCFSDNSERLFFGQSYNVSNGYEMMCEMTKNGTFHIRPTACLHNGVRYNPSEVYQDNYYWYTCRLMGEGIANHVSGCIDAEGKRVEIGDVFKQGSYLYQCNLNADNSGIKLEPVACLHNGERYEEGDTMIDGLFWYTCKKHSDFISAQLSGCFYGNKTMKVSDKYYRNGFVYQCQKKGTNSLGHIIVGCLETHQETGATIAERKFNEQWTIGKKPYKFMTRCERHGDSGATQRLTNCMYEPDGSKNKTMVDPGCYKFVNPEMMVLCYSRDDGGLGIDRATPEEMYKVTSRGLRDC